MDAMRGQGGIQMLLTAEQEAQQIVTTAKNNKLGRLRQAKVEAENEIAQYRAHLEDEYRKNISENSGNSDFTVKKLDVETGTKIQSLKEAASISTADVVTMLMKYITNVKN